MIAANRHLAVATKFLALLLQWLARRKPYRTQSRGALQCMNDKEYNVRARTWLILVGLFGLCACGADKQDPAATSRSAGAAAESESSRASGSERYERASFVLCPALEAHRAELAAIVGFEERDPARPIEGVGRQCFIRGEYSHVSIELAPAVYRSILMQGGAYDADTSPAPELGNHALFIDALRQPHVVFPLGDLFINVGAEASEKPTRETMIQLATRVRELLVAANK